MFSAMLADGARSTTPADAETFAPVLAAHTADALPARLDVRPDIAMLTTAVTKARRQYQACHYSDLIKHLPNLLAHSTTSARPPTNSSPKRTTPDSALG
jgi:hypothetical protein